MSRVDTELGRERLDEALERLELIRGDDAAIAEFLDGFDLRGPRERALLVELARTRTISQPDLFPHAHRRAVAALESLGRHGYHEPSLSRRLGPLRGVVRYLIGLVARYVVVSYLRRVSTEMRNLYWLRAIQSEPDGVDRSLLERARNEADGLRVVFQRREVGLPSFVFGGLLVSILATLWRATQGLAFDSWWGTVATGGAGLAVALVVSWIILRGAAMASRRIRLSARLPLETLWNTLGNCGRPPGDQSKQFALIAISLVVGAWIVLPLAIVVAVWR